MKKRNNAFSFVDYQSIFLAEVESSQCKQLLRYFQATPHDRDRLCRKLPSITDRAYYSKFDETTQAEPQKSQPNCEKGLISLATVAAILYSAICISRKNQKKKIDYLSIY